MPSEDNKILKYNHGEKSVKAPFVIYDVFERLLKKLNTSRNSPKKSWTTKINEHTPSCIFLYITFIQYLHIVHLM